MRVAFLGLGLIGGSVARALAGHPGEWRAAAWTPSGAGPRLAAEEGVIELAASTPAAAVEGAGLVVLAAPPLDCLDLLRLLAGPLRSSLATGAVITDVASTKGAISGLADEIGLRFVGGHPMAGRDTDGFAASDAAMFHGRPWVVVPSRDEEAVSRVEELVAACGARAVRMTAAEHDRAVAAISHLPLVLSAALVEAVAGTPGSRRADWPAAAALAAGGWAGMTRLARGDVDM
ncbi:MAG: prephenate dehydrogenase, partial [Chloroflexota bacterium]